MIDRETGTRVGRRLYIGWDVGGWLGKTDGLAAYTFGHSGTLLRHIPGRTVSLWKELEGQRWSLERLLRLLDPMATLDRFDRVVLAVNAPLGVPARFTQAIQSDIARVPEPEYALERFADWRLAYRVTDRLVAKRFDVKPLSPSLDRLTNNGTKARAAIAEFIWINFTSACIPESQRGEDANALDATVCALNAVWYDVAATGIARGRFPLLPPVDPGATPAPEIVAKNMTPDLLREYEPEASEEDRAAIAQEGWIWAPDLLRS